MRFMLYTNRYIFGTIAIASGKCLKKSYCDNSPPTTPSSEEIHKDVDIIIKAMKQRFPTFVEPPKAKTAISIHGATSAGKSSFINDIYGFQIKAHRPEKVDDNLTIIVTVDCEKFKNYLMGYSTSDSAITTAKIKEELKRKSFSDLHTPLIGNDILDDRKKYAFLVLNAQQSQELFHDYGFTELTRQTSPQSQRLRALIINESVYENENIFSRKRYDGELSKSERIQAARSLVVIDTPGIETDVHKTTELKAILSQTSHSFFLLSIGEGNNRDSLRVYAKALLDKGKESEIWSKSTFLLTKVDKVLNSSPTGDDHVRSAVHQKLYEFGALFRSVNEKISEPALHRWFFVGFPDCQNQNIQIGSLPMVYERLRSILSQKLTPDYQNIYR